tara:strand:- start:4196 stop:4327 length:132 start_codon:yes stop_codon:yes gene_type:complete
MVAHNTTHNVSRIRTLHIVNKELNYPKKYEAFFSFKTIKKALF